MTIKAGFSLEDITVQRIGQMAAATRRDKSAIVDMAVALLAQQEEFANLDTSLPTPVRKTRKPIEKIEGVRKGA